MGRWEMGEFGLVAALLLAVGSCIVGAATSDPPLTGIPLDSPFEPACNCAIIFDTGKQVRISILSPQVARIEYDPTGNFTDLATLQFVNRDNHAQVAINSSREGGWLNVSFPNAAQAHISGISLHEAALAPGACNPNTWQSGTDVVCNGKCQRSAAYPNGAPAETVADCCQLCSSQEDCATFVYDSHDHVCFMLQPGTVTGTQPAANRSTSFTARPLDGLVFVSGTFSNGSTWEFVLGEADPRNLLGTIGPTPSTDLAGCCNNRWVDATRGLRSLQDDYIFGCGSDYAQCLGAYTALAGNISMPPSHALGVWWSRHWGVPEDGAPFGPMTENNIKTEVVDQYLARELPLQVVVTDMEWHSMLSPTDCATFIGVKGWGGYTWNNTLFSDPHEFVEYLHARDIKLVLNFHPDEGAVFLVSVLKLLNRAKRKARQAATALSSLMPVTLVAKQALTDAKRITKIWLRRWVRVKRLEPKRAAIPVSEVRIQEQLKDHTVPRLGFLEIPCADGTRLPMRSHDIGGFSGGEVDAAHHTESPELFLRWLQFAVFAPIFRTHCRYCEQRIWTFGEPWYGLMRETMLLRSMLGPYIYTQARHTYETGVGLVHPLYYEYPQDEEVYGLTAQHMFGEDVWAAPIVQPSGPADSTIKVFYVPVTDERGSWWDMQQGGIPIPGLTTTRVSNNTLPWFVRAGAPIPLRSNATRFEDVTANLTWLLAPARTDTTFARVLYEDDGESMAAFTQGAYLQTNVRAVHNASGLRLEIDAAENPSGAFKPTVSERTLRVVLLGVVDPRGVLVNGATVVTKTVKLDELVPLAGSYECTLVTIPALALTATLSLEVAL
ncbi:uncharacterized protein MONBRDRAFT_29377 [Monosiga brevicollis MX1]|uniref:Apple domain-containing protein n=1 Tax=Monosiga brevicollis TaxID=81824 RepID=A9VAX1_MONBE|nr:uncharacterized protein MONBRDRAFT_29377 [Monosiga brevicollis MX1]EDQ85239.1 predicted protein [Monosiga brevicollis MX1]|eukprot:XP_001749860.1 hypothetical protein [Monosiga brevicollis MX1]